MPYKTERRAQHSILMRPLTWRAFRGATQLAVRKVEGTEERPPCPDFLISGWGREALTPSARPAGRMTGEDWQRAKKAGLRLPEG